MHLDTILVVPFDDSVNFLSIPALNDHRSFIIHLPDEIVIFRIGLLRRSRLLPVGFWIKLLFFYFREVGPDQFSVQDTVLPPEPTTTTMIHFYYGARQERRDLEKSYLKW